MAGMRPNHNLQTGKTGIKVGKEKEVLTNFGRAGCHLNKAYKPIIRDIIIQN